MMGELVIKVEDLVGHLERERAFSGTREVELRLGDVTISGPMAVSGAARGTVDSVNVTFDVTATANFSCVRCLTTWTGPVEVSGSQYFAGRADGDGYGIVEGEIDVGDPAKDELALALPAAPLCRDDCKGLCPICGTDLNEGACDGHGDDSDSPFSVLKDLFDS